VEGGSHDQLQGHSTKYMPGRTCENQTGYPVTVRDSNQITPGCKAGAQQLNKTWSMIHFIST
jgi:hypothetical protein